MALARETVGGGTIRPAAVSWEGLVSDVGSRISELQTQQGWAQKNEGAEGVLTRLFSGHDDRRRGARDSKAATWVFGVGAGS
jgi:hypothetical protein